MKLTAISKALIGAVAFLGLASAANATLVLTPSTPGVIPSNAPSNCQPGCVESAFGVTGLQNLYRAEYLGDESGSYENSYNTDFGNWDFLFDPSNATISHRNGRSDIDCGGCYLSVKDGNNTPRFYFFDISSWNGSEDISLRSFWENGPGSIQQITIWGGGTKVVKVPEPSTLALFGLGLLAAGLARRRKRS